MHTEQCEGDDWHHFHVNNHCYRVLYNDYSFDVSENTCNTHGGKLASVGFEAEKDYLVAKVKIFAEGISLFNNVGIICVDTSFSFKCLEVDRN